VDALDLGDILGHALAQVAPVAESREGVREALIAQSFVGEAQFLGALGNLGFQFLGLLEQPPGPVPDHSGHQPQASEDLQGYGPPGEPGGGQHFDPERDRARFVPGEIPPPHLEGVRSRRKRGVFTFGVGQPFGRLGFQAFQLGAVAGVLFPEEAQQGVFKRQAGAAPGDFEQAVRRLRRASELHVLQQQGFGRAIKGFLGKIQHGCARHGARPQASAAVHEAGAHGASVARQSIARGVGVQVEKGWILRRGIPRREADDSAVREHKDTPLIVLGQLVHQIAGEGRQGALPHGFPCP